ncbi:unnamed protein product [marine sediment metagenome]|uniref:Uncharacterized protein n=1 Tax=marine sediment metagenome TaxID=412755 RepID=X1E1P2_9ZZZZ
MSSLETGEFHPREEKVIRYVLENFEHTSLSQETLLREILNGAYVLLEDNGKAYEDWAKELAGIVKPTAMALANRFFAIDRGYL